MKIFFVFPRLDVGGVSKVFSNLIPEFVNVQAEISVVVNGVDERAISWMPSNVRIVDLGGKSSLLYGVALLREFVLNKPTHVISAGEDINCFVIVLNLILRLRAKIIVTAHSNYSMELRGSVGLAKKFRLNLVKFIMRIFYPHSDHVVAVSAGVADDLMKCVRLDKDKIKVIYNPIITADFRELIDQPIDIRLGVLPEVTRKIIFIGRLCKQKRPDLLLNAFFKLRKKVDAVLWVLGDGPLMGDLREISQSSSCSDDIKFLGLIANPLPYLKQSDILVLPSDWEGFGNVIVEALWCGVPVVATDCPSGPSEILDGGKYGYLVRPNDVDGLVIAMLRALQENDAGRRGLLQQRAERFSAGNAAKKYIELLAG
ncbi:glycosyltransferase [Azonexus sp.]|uniref:glycosyltransferase n=1 Tax=Azonexus sp. TaxID=1872668 RepID=UPI0035B181C5